MKNKYLTMKIFMNIRLLKVAMLSGFLCFFTDFTGQECVENRLPTNENEQTGIVCECTERASDYLICGMQYDDAGNYKAAIEAYTRAIEMDPDFAEAFDKRGISYTKILMYRKALKDFSKAIDLKKNNAEAFNHIGIIFYCLGEFEKSIAAYNKALEIDPNYAKVYFNRGIVELVIDNEQEAISDIKMASNLNVKEASDYLSSININTN
jgi:tetratricopeptide (TPR) repeat protein